MLKIKICKTENKQKNLINQLYKFGKRKVQPSFIHNISGADLVNIQLISKTNKGVLFLLCVIDIFSKYAWVALLKNQKCTAITNSF